MESWKHSSNELRYCRLVICSLFIVPLHIASEILWNCIESNFHIYNLGHLRHWWNNFIRTKFEYWIMLLPFDKRHWVVREQVFLMKFLHWSFHRKQTFFGIFKSMWSIFLMWTSVFLLSCILSVDHIRWIVHEYFPLFVLLIDLAFTYRVFRKVMPWFANLVQAPEKYLN